MKQSLKLLIGIGTIATMIVMGVVYKVNVDRAYAELIALDGENTAVEECKVPTPVRSGDILMIQLENSTHVSDPLEVE